MKHPTKFIALAGHGDEPDVEDEPTASSGDPQSSAENDTKTAPSEDEPEVTDSEEAENTSTEVPDTSNLAIDKVIEETDEKKQEELRQKQIERTSEIEESLDDASLIGTAVESYLQDVQRKKVDPFLTLGVLNSIRRRQGAQAISMEGFKSSGASVVVENFRNAHDVVVAKIATAVDSIRQVTVQQLKGLAQGIGAVNSEQQKYAEQISSNRQLDRLPLEVTLKTKLSVSGAYFADAKIQRYDQHGSPYKTDDVLPHVHVARACSLFSALQFFQWNESVNLPETMQQLLHRFSAGNHTDTASVSAPLPEPEVLIDKLKTSRVAYIDGIRCQDDRALHAAQHYLGGVSFILELDQEAWGQDPLSRLAAMGAWRSQFARAAKNAVGTDVRFLSKEEVEDCQKHFDALAVKIAGLLDFADRYDQCVMQLGKVIQTLSGKGDQVLGGDDQLERQQLQLIALKASAAWLINSSNTASFLCGYFTELNQAWGELLKAQVANQKTQ